MRFLPLLFLFACSSTTPAFDPAGDDGGKNTSTDAGPDSPSLPRCINRALPECQPTPLGPQGPNDALAGATTDAPPNPALIQLARLATDGLFILSQECCTNWENMLFVLHPANGQYRDVDLKTPYQPTGLAYAAGNVFVGFPDSQILNRTSPSRYLAFKTISTSSPAARMPRSARSPRCALGHEYAAGYRPRAGQTSESLRWRLVGAVDGTTLSYDPPVKGAPATLKLGDVVHFDSAARFSVASEDAAHPFILESYMTGGLNSRPRATRRWCPSSLRANGDSYVFFTDPTYPETNLVFVREATKAADVTLDCLGSVGGWKPIGSMGRYEFARVDLVRGNFQKQGACDNGRHVATSASAFSLTVWGWGSAATMPAVTEFTSYGYPAGAGVRPINERRDHTQLM